MSDPTVGLDPTGAVGEAEPRPKRRKIRKGTQSCWECKRRKVRCTYAKPTASICDGCRSRRTECVSQEFDDGAGGASPAGEQSVRQSRAVRISDGHRPNDTHGQEQNPGMKSSLDSETAVDRTCPARLRPSSSTESQHDEIYRALLELWPNEEERDSILHFQVHASTLYHGIIFKPYSHFLSDKMYEPPHKLLKLPPSGSHPVSIARKTLLLASWLQDMPPISSTTTGQHRTGSYYDYASQLVGAAARLVTSDDELVCSIEGVECLMIESMYLNNGGQLRRAWLTNRKAMAIAQMLGLHQEQESSTSSGAYIDENASRPRIDPGYMWLRLVLSDRYLSLMLGLPLNIDNLLQEATACMPPQWWIGDFVFISSLVYPDISEDFPESLRLVNHIAYHHLLIQLHLPYMLQDPPSTSPNAYDYSKMTAAIASRAVLLMWVNFRASQARSKFCRGIEFIAFTASMTLCLAHMECGRRRSNGSTSGGSSSAFQALRHQRLGDRGLIERTLQIMEHMASQNKDAVAQKISVLLSPLLQLECDSASGVECRVTASLQSSDAAIGPESQWTRAASDGMTPGVLSIQIPYFGNIKIEHCRESAGGSIDPSALSQDQGCMASASKGDGFDDPINGIHRLGYELTTAQSANADWQVVPSFLDHTSPLRPPIQAQATHVTSEEDEQAMNSSQYAARPENAHLLVPGLDVELDDWVLQGVDAAFFGSLVPPQG
ncbi:uncharacterized protein PG998_007091 [Apiospora kogelbergensis]|uniref:uncharacterized protein n=1 Tax=Apiospora kogelbergensis TaxID=1337665 RepID=UPI003131AB1A